MYPSVASSEVVFWLGGVKVWNFRKYGAISSGPQPSLPSWAQAVKLDREGYMTMLKFIADEPPTTRPRGWPICLLLA